MIHKAWTVGWGNSDDLLATAALLEKIDDTLADTYVAETGQKKDEIVSMMAAETWLTSKEAVDLGFADRVAEAAPKASATGWNLAAYANAPAPATEQPEDTSVDDAARFRTVSRSLPLYDRAFFESLNARLRTVRANRR
jgi:ATP-dependent Clp protease protease subunit